MIGIIPAQLRDGLVQHEFSLESFTFIMLLLKVMEIKIRNEEIDDYRTVEEITRTAFWNLHVPGCDEHFLAHKLRNHSDFIPELDFVAVKDDVVVGNIMYSDSFLLDDNDNKLSTITFGPVSVHPSHQRQGVGSELISYSTELATNMGYNAIVIQGNPSNYCKFGFKSSKAFNIATPERRFPCSLLVMELKKGVLSNLNWRFFESKAYELDLGGFEEYEATFKKMKKEYKYTQELFSILSKAYIEE